MERRFTNVLWLSVFILLKLKKKTLQTALLLVGLISKSKFACIAMFSEFTKLELQAPTIKIQAVVFVLASVCASTRWRLLGGESGAAADRQYSAVHGYTREFGRVLIYQSYGKVI